MMKFGMLLMGRELPFSDYIKLSDFLPSSVDESILGLEINQARTAYTAQVQQAVNEASSQKIPLIWDKAVAINDIIKLKSDTHIYTLPSKGAILSDGTNKAMFQNENIIFRENSRIIDKNIKIEGGIWNGNGLKQQEKNNAFGVTLIFGFYGVENLHLSKHQMFLPKTYCQQAINIKNGVVEDFVIDVGRNGSINMDGVHFDGWCNDCRISRGVINAYDDGVGCNADDFYYNGKYFDGGSKSASFFYEDPCGPANNIIFEDLHFNRSLFGIRILSSRSRVDNITIRNLSGITMDYAVLIDNYWRSPASIQNAGIGNIGTVTIDNVDMVVNRGLFSDSQDATISLSSSIENLIMTNITPNTGGNVPTFTKHVGGEGLNAYEYGNLTLNGQSV